jgi:hypothetical protein
MRKKFFVSFLFVVAFLTLAATSFASGRAESLARQAVSENPVESKKAIASLRSMGEDGLMSLFAVYANDIRRYMETGEQSVQWLKIAAALDSVAMQKGSYASRLFWQTDFEQAKREAQKSGKPILSLRLLGNLNEEFSCANSRFFRSVLYANDEVSKILRERFVLHWKSVRPAPKVTIDFGDGRKIETTITGNSIHYALDSNGQPIDTLPGLYGPRAFQRWLLQVETLARDLKRDSGQTKEMILYSYHNTMLKAVLRKWQDELDRTKANLPKDEKSVKATDGNPTAVQAAPLAVTKMVALEGRILKSTQRDALTLEMETGFDEWKKLATLYPYDARLDKNSIAFIHRQNMKLNSEELKRLINRLEGFIALDTVRNEYLMHRKLHSWFLSGFGNDLNSLNEKVYAELFLTPSADPWLGLYSPDTYTAIDGGGIIK